MFLRIREPASLTPVRRGRVTGLGGKQMVKILKSRLKSEYPPVEDTPLAVVKALKALAEAEKVSR